MTLSLSRGIHKKRDAVISQMCANLLGIYPEGGREGLLYYSYSKLTGRGLVKNRETKEIKFKRKSFW